LNTFSKATILRTHSHDSTSIQYKLKMLFEEPTYDLQGCWN